MENHYSFLKFGLSFTVLVFLIFSCGGSTSSHGTTGVADNGVVKFKRDGVDWISGPPGHPELNFEEEAITHGNTIVRIEAFASNGSHLALSINKSSGIGPGTYPIN